MARGSIINSFNANSVDTDTQTAGLTLVDALALSPELGDLFRWMTRQKELSLAEVMAFTGESEATSRAMLNSLIRQGFVQEVAIGREPYFRAHFADKRGRQLTENIWQSLTPGSSPLTVVRNPSVVPSVVAGATFELYVTVNNEGNQSALVDVCIDETCQPVYQWCAAPFERLALGPKQSGEVVFHFQIPLQTLPDTYDYLLVVDAQDHYPEDTPIQFSHQLRVLPPVQETVQINDPTFSLLPVTSSDLPAPLQPGQVLEVVATVQNRSDRVDQFRLVCPDLPADWFTIRYPEGLTAPGLVTTPKCLDLNPGETAQILMLIHPPLNALAGDYFPTIQLHSSNYPDLDLLDVLYLRILPTYFLTSELRTVVGKVKRGAGKYEVRLANEGNTSRAIALTALSHEEDDLCLYTLDSSQLILPPKTAATVGLQVQPKHWWRRPFYGGGRLLTFAVDLHDVEALPVQNPPQGTLVWEPRPWWQALLVAMTTMGAIATAILLIWWIFFRPAPAPKVLEFTTNDASYQEADGDFVRLNWRVSNPAQLAAIRITSKAPDGTAAGQPQIYDFSQGIPVALKDSCMIQRILICRNVQTDARRAGAYVFELAVIPKGNDGEVTNTANSNVRINSAKPRIVYFRINGQDAPSTKYLVAIAPTLPPNPLTLSWQVEGSSTMKVELLPSPGVVRPTGYLSYPLTRQPSTTTLTLKVTSESGEEITRSVVIETYVQSAPTNLPSPSAIPGLLPPPPTTIPTIPIPGTPTVLPSLSPISGADSGSGSGSASGAGASDGGATEPASSASPDPNAPAPSNPDELSPTELPPQFQ
jgi:hypothetical protein